jgi:hypothetical protein
MADAVFGEETFVPVPMAVYITSNGRGGILWNLTAMEMVVPQLTWINRPGLSPRRISRSPGTAPGKESTDG